LQELPSQDCLEKLKVTDRILANCLIIPYYLLERVINNRYHIPFEKITQLICYSDYGYRAASTKTSSNWLFCLKCYESGHVSLLENGTCLVCGGGRKKITRFDPKSIEKLIHNVINELSFYDFYYPTLVQFIRGVTDALKDPLFKGHYLSRFNKYENEIIHCESSYLKSPKYQMRHLDAMNSSKRKSHSLSEEELLNTKIMDEEYTRAVSLQGYDPSAVASNNKLFSILNNLKYPRELIKKKIHFDILSSLELQFIEIQRSHIYPE
jgi:hypothetical protein